MRLRKWMKKMNKSKNKKKQKEKVCELKKNWKKKQQKMFKELKQVLRLMWCKNSIRPQADVAPSCMPIVGDQPANCLHHALP